MDVSDADAPVCRSEDPVEDDFPRRDKGSFSWWADCEPGMSPVESVHLRLAEDSVVHRYLGPVALEPEVLKVLRFKHCEQEVTSGFRSLRGHLGSVERFVSDQGRFGVAEVGCLR